MGKLLTYAILPIAVFSIPTASGLSPPEPQSTDEKNEQLLNLAGFASHSSKNLQLNGFGSGFAVTSNGYVVTASHVTEGSDAVRVVFKNGESHEAKVLKEERGLDLAILKIDAKTPTFLSVASRTAGLGDDVYTIGYPSPLLLGTNQKFTKGSISALTGLKNDSFRYQISVPIQPGNSGGALVSEETGEVVGIVVSSLKGKDVVGFTPQNVNYALKSGFIKPILDALEIKSEKVKAAVSKNDRRQRVVDATCMIVTCKFSTLKSKPSSVPPPLKSPKVPNGKTYKVKRGDTLWSIAVKNGVSLSALLTANPSLDKNSRLALGQVLIIPPLSQIVPPIVPHRPEPGDVLIIPNSPNNPKVPPSELNAYLTKVQAQFDKVWKKSQSSTDLGSGGEAVLSFRISSNGTIISAKLSRLSGNKALDELVLRVSRMVGNVGVPPGGKLDSTLTLPFKVD